MKPPVEAPTSRMTLFVGSMCQVSRAFSSLSAPRLTYSGPLVFYVDVRLWRDALRGTRGAAAVNAHGARQDQRVRPLACFGQTTSDQDKIESLPPFGHGEKRSEEGVTSRMCQATYSSRYSRSFVRSFGWRSLLSAMPSIWRTRSLVTPRRSAISPRVCSRPPDRP